jgi:hypothetical protein
VRYLGEVDTSEAATRKLVAGLAARYRKLTFCYEAGPTGYGLQRLIETLGHTCIVAAPSLIPKKAGERVKTNRRDAERLARLLRAGELTAVWVPDGRHEAMRELTRAREAARGDLTRKRQQVSSLLLRLGRHYPGIKTWNARHRSWLANLRLDHPEQRFALEEMLQAERQAGERIGARSPGKPRSGSASGSARCRARARSPQWWQPPSHASWRPSSGPLRARSGRRRSGRTEPDMRGESLHPINQKGSSPAIGPGEPAVVQRRGRGHGRGALANTTWPIHAIDARI